MRRDERVARLRTHNLQLAGYDDEQRDTPVAGVVQHFPERCWAAPSANRHSGDLRRRQRRKGVLRVHNGGLQKAHGRIARVHGISVSAVDPVINVPETVSPPWVTT